jgi:hypothetical protein
MGVEAVFRRWLFLRAIVLGVIAIVVSGCVSMPVSPSTASQIPKDRLLAFQERTAENSATLVVTRDAGIAGSACYLSFSLNGMHAARFGVAETAQFYVAPGEILLRVGADWMGQGLCGLASKDFGTQRETIIRPGQTKHFRLTTDPNGMLDVQRAEPHE